MTADCAVLAADYPDSTVNEVINDAGFLVGPIIKYLTEILNIMLWGE